MRTPEPIATQMFAVVVLLVLVVVASGCASAIPSLRSDVAARAAAQPSSSSLPAYDLTGAVWVSNRFLLVNSDYPFDMAMAGFDFGPGLAAGQRFKRNQETAEQLRALEPMALDQAWKTALQRASNLTAEDRQWLRQRSDAVLFGILFGAPKAQLRVVLELPDQRWVWLSEPRALEGRDSWTADGGRRLVDEFRGAGGQANPRSLVNLARASTHPGVALYPHPSDSQSFERLFISPKFRAAVQEHETFQSLIEPMSE
ncbi:MAG: hypothetical protein ABIP44_04105 [Pseudoxanthomonas sp.]